MSPGARRTVQVLLGAALGTTLISYLLMAAVAALAGLSVGAWPTLAGLSSVAVPLWLAAQQTPLTVAGAPLSLLPLLPTLAVAALAAHVAAAAVDKLERPRAAWVVCAMAGTQAALAVLGTALPTEPVHAQPWQALVGGGVVVGFGATAGVLRAVGTPTWWDGLPGWLRTGLAAGATGAAALLVAAALMLFAALVADLGAVHDGFASRPGWGEGIGLAAISVCYLPNALVAAVGWLAGPGVGIGTAVASPLSVSVGPLPPVPLLAAMPTAAPPGWAVAVFALPMAAGVLTGLVCRRGAEDPMDRLRAVAVAVFGAALGYGVLASVAGGRLATGPFDPVDLSALSGALALLGWLGVPASVAAVTPGRAWLRRLSVPTGNAEE